MHKQTVISLLLTTIITLYGMDRSIKTNTIDPQVKLNKIINEIIDNKNINTDSVIDEFINNSHFSEAPGAKSSEFPKSRLFIITKTAWTPKKPQQSKL